MTSDFPCVYVIGDEEIARGLIAPALSLGIRLEIVESGFSGDCDVLTLVGNNAPISKVPTWEAKGLRVRPSSSVIAAGKHGADGEDGDYFVLVAQSPHGQGSAWTPMEKIELGGNLAISSAITLSEGQIAQLQSVALQRAREIKLVGVACLGIEISKQNFEISSLALGPSRLGDWSVAGARTSQYEQHLRAILDLPLGETRRSAQHVVTGFFQGKPGTNMYRPYLHLMARNPGLKFHHYLPGVSKGAGYVTALGNNLLDLRENVAHAIEYLNGEINE